MTRDGSPSTNNAGATFPDESRLTPTSFDEHVRLTEHVEKLVRHLHATGEFDAGTVAFTACHFHTPAELVDELTAAGLGEVEVFGTEGPVGLTLRALGMDRLEALLLAAVRAAASSSATRR